MPFACELCSERPAVLDTEALGRRNLGFARCSGRGRGVHTHAFVKGQDGKVVSASQGTARFALPLQLDGPLDSLAAQRSAATGVMTPSSRCFTASPRETGKDRQELDQVAERIFVLHRALTIRDMKTREMRLRHDLIPEWVFEDPSGKAPFSKGTIRMDRKDIQVAIDMFYEEMGWDRATGAPTSKAYQRVGLGNVAAELGRRNLLPDVA